MATARLRVLICTGKVCEKKGASAVESALRSRLVQFGLNDEIKVTTADDCVGYCKQAPVMMIYPDNILYGKVKVEDVEEIVEEHFLKGRPVKRLIDDSLDAQDVLDNMRKANFFKGQEVRVVMENAGIIDPESIEEYIGRDGYQALGKVLGEMSPEDVVDEITRSGLRGRGGGGFPRHKINRAVVSIQEFNLDKVGQAEFRIQSIRVEPARRHQRHQIDCGRFVPADKYNQFTILDRCV